VSLLNAIDFGPQDRIVLLGDLIDRGAGSADVLTHVIKLSREHQNTHIIMGNHEQMMLESRNSKERYSDWIANGGDATLRSYGPGSTLATVPDSHWHFLQHQLVPYVETETHILVHANAYGDLSMVEQPDYMLRWEPCDQIAPHQSGKTIVCGHTPQKSGDPMNKGYAICIDTNACRGGWLTCLELNSGRICRAKGNRVEQAHITDFAD